MHRLNILISLAASLSIVVTVVFVLVKNWRDRVMRYYAFYSICAFGILFTMFIMYTFPLSFDMTVLNRITQFSTLMTFSSFLAMSFVFPKTEKHVPFWGILLVLLPALVLAILVLATDFSVIKVSVKGGKLLREYNTRTKGYSIYSLVAYSYLLIGLFSFIRRYIKTKVRIYRLQMRYLFIGQGVAHIGSSFAAIILPAVFNYSALYVIAPSVSTLFAVCTLFYSVIAYNLADVTTVIHKTFVYIVISMVIIFPIFGIVYAYDNRLWFFGEVPYYVIALAVVVVFLVFSVYLQPVIDRVFKRKQYAFGSAVDKFIMDNQAVRDLTEIVKRTVDVLRESLSLKHVFCILLNDQSRNFELYYYRGSEKEFQIPPIERNASIIRWFVRNQDILQLSRVYMDESSFREIREEILAFFVDNGIQMILPIYHDRKMVGLLCLGIKETLAGFRPDEIEKLGHFSARSNDFISAALTYEKAMKDQLVARTIDLSSQILKKALPPALPNINTVKFGAFIHPKYREGSDYFDFIRPGEQGLGIITTDIPGMGVNSALYSVVLRSAFQASISFAPSTSNVMQNLNRILYDYSRGAGGSLTAFYLYYDIKSKRLMYTNAGYTPLELYRYQKNNFDSLSTEGAPLGAGAEGGYGIARTDLAYGDIGILYSASLTASKSQKGEEFGLLKLRNIVREFRTQSASDIALQIQNSFKTFLGLSNPDSDVVVLVFKSV